MKSTIIILSLVVASLGFWSCSKSNDSNPTPTKYTFSLNGNTYNQLSAADSSSSTLVSDRTVHVISVAGASADGKAQAQVDLIFAGSAKPAAGTYAIVDTATALSSGNVAIFAIDRVSASKGGLYGSSKTDQKITITLNSGKYAVSIPSVPVHGVNIDNSDPKSSVYTNVTGSASGSFSE